MLPALLVEVASVLLVKGMLFMVPLVKVLVFDVTRI